VLTDFEGNSQSESIAGATRVKIMGVISIIRGVHSGGAGEWRRKHSAPNTRADRADATTGPEPAVDIDGRVQNARRLQPIAQ
jgi:hypothetical protein